MKDPEFLKDAERGNVEINLVDAAEVEAVLKEAAASPPAVIERVNAILDRK